MNRRHFSVLMVATVVAVMAVALLLPGKTGREDGPLQELLLPSLKQWVNEADRVTVQAAGARTVATLVRGDDRWSVDELGGYPADWTRLRDLLTGLAEAVIVELKTENPTYYGRLGVADISSEDSDGMLVMVEGDGNSAAVLLGDTPQGRGGQFARLPDTARSVLVDRELNVPLEAVEWVDRDIVDLPAADVAEVQLKHADGETVTLRKVSADDTDYTLLELPEGREVKSSWSVNSIASAFSDLRFDDVRRDTEVDWQNSLQIHVVTFSGMVHDLELATFEDQHWLRYSTAPGELAEDTAELPAWAYEIPPYKHDSMNKRLEDLLQAAETE